MEMPVDPACKGSHAEFEFRHMRPQGDCIQDWNEIHGMKLQAEMTKTKWGNPIPMRPMDN